ncbi:HIT domain-containing protein [Candidatus Babeliales bacterium]|nr:HIT domain-containing protein [Candidatus Babeliales bacterium]
MKKLYAPWRNTYTQEEALKNKDDDPQSACVFCKKLAENEDRKHYILERFRHCTVLLNLYPYNAGHLLIITNEHHANLNSLSPAARTELIELTNSCIEILKTALGCHGTNVGLNLGKIAGAGIPAHLHMHILPRWLGDTNFLPTLTDTKAISFDLNDIYNELKPYFEKNII